MEDKPPIMPPQSEPFPGSKTPGWNDPPPLQYNAASSSGSRPRLNLNKRVAFPLQGNTAVVAKPTAVVQPNQTTTSSPSGSSGMLPLSMPPVTQPIAVVHPMHTPMSNVNTTSQPPAMLQQQSQLPPPPPSSSSNIANLSRGPPSSGTFAASDASNTVAATTATASPTLQDHTTTLSSGSSNLPTMHVPAMPRQESAEMETRSIVQHI